MYQRDYEKKLNVGIIGAGSHMYRNLLPALHYLPVRLAAICNRGEDKLNRTIEEYHCPGYRTPEEMYEKENLDAVIIAVSPFMHPELACQAMEHGVHAFIEKPAAANMAGIMRMIETSKRTGKYVVVGYKKAFMPVTDKVIDILSSEMYPDMTSMLAVYPLYLPKDGKKALEEQDFNEWMKNGCHPLSFMLQVAGPVRSVTALTNESGFGTVVLKFENGVIGNLHLADVSRPARDEYRIYGNGWSIEIEGSSRIALRRGIPDFDYNNAVTFAPEGFDGGDLIWEPATCQASPENKALFVQGMVQQLNYFCQCVLNNTPPTRGSLEFARQITQVFEAALVSGGKEIGL